MNCSWQGFKIDLKEHAKAEHSNYFFENAKLIFASRYEESVFAILSCFGELFVYYQDIRDGKLYGAVQLIGTSSEASKYKCEFTLRAANGIEQISKTFLVRSSTEDWETSFNSGKCLRLDEETVRNFLVENVFNLTITLSPV
jgi:hypothetical protein